MEFYRTWEQKSTRETKQQWLDEWPRSKFVLLGVHPARLAREVQLVHQGQGERGPRGPKLAREKWKVKDLFSSSSEAGRASYLPRNSSM